MFALALLLQLQIPQPTGFVNDFAGIIDARSEAQMLAVIQEVRTKAGGEIAVVTLRDLGGRASIEVGRDIGREWGVGAQGGPGDQARNAGVVLLLVPGERPGDGRADLAVATGRGSEGFITDARAGRIRDAIGRVSVETGSYAQGLVAGVWLLAEAYSQEFGFALTGEAPVRIPPRSGQPAGAPPMAIFWVLFLALPVMAFAMSAVFHRRMRYRYHRGARVNAGELLLWSLIFGGMGRRRTRHGGWSAGGGWGGGGFSGGGFGGFGGGGGFSGGGASGSF
jgi:uncharacterized protein